jgi:hypothetical protein
MWTYKGQPGSNPEMPVKFCGNYDNAARVSGADYFWLAETARNSDESLEAERVCCATWNVRARRKN